MISEHVFIFCVHPVWQRRQTVHFQIHDQPLQGKIMSNSNLKMRGVAVLTGGVIMASALFHPAPAQAADNKSEKLYKGGAVALGVLGAYFILKGKTIPGAAAGAGAYYAYKKGKDADKERDRSANNNNSDNYYSSSDDYYADNRNADDYDSNDYDSDDYYGDDEYYSNNDYSNDDADLNGRWSTPTSKNNRAVSGVTSSNTKNGAAVVLK